MSQKGLQNTLEKKYSQVETTEKLHFNSIMENSTRNDFFAEDPFEIRGKSVASKKQQNLRDMSTLMSFAICC